MPDDFTQGHGARHYYDMFEMQMEGLAGVGPSGRPEIALAGPADADRLYQVLCQAFAHNPDTSIPDAQSWKRSFMESRSGHFYVWKEEGNIQGFAQSVDDEEGKGAEIRTLGVLDAYRGKGIGNHLLKHCLHQSAKSGRAFCHLSVAVANPIALGLYTRAGFKVVGKYSCYRFPVLSNN